MKKTVFVIHILEEGVLAGTDPDVFSSEAGAFKYFAKEVQGMGFRQPLEREKFSAYREAFSEWEKSEACPYDGMDWEIACWKLRVRA